MFTFEQKFSKSIIQGLDIAEQVRLAYHGRRPDCWLMGSEISGLLQW